jgi:hypothetical protein
MIDDWNSTVGQTYAYLSPRVAAQGGVPYRGLSVNKTIVQQGLTANVSCRQQNFSDPTVFPFTMVHGTTFSFNYAFNSSVAQQSQFPNHTVTAWLWNTTCSNDTYDGRLSTSITETR